jgi:hypothetical protein
MSLLSLVYHQVTKLAITLKPSSPTFKAALSPGKELAAHLDALASCACSLNKDLHGESVVKEVRWATEDVLNGVESLLTVYLGDTHYQQGASEAGERDSRGAPYLVRTAVIHEAIDRARANTEREGIQCRHHAAPLDKQ